MFYWTENGELWGWKIPSAGQFSRSLKLVNISGFVMQSLPEASMGVISQVNTTAQRFSVAPCSILAQ